MNILFLFCSLPNLKSDTGLYASLIHEFRNHGHSVYVSTKGCGVRKTILVEEGGIPVIRIQSLDFTGVAGSVKKALGYIQYSIKQVWFTKRFFKKQKFDLIISHSLPPEIGFIAHCLRRKYKCPFYQIVSDFTWEDAVAYNYFSKNGPVGLYYRYCERVMMIEADYISVPTEGNVSFIKNLHPQLPDDKFHVLPFWQKQLMVTPDYALREQFGLKDKFVVIYGGSVGAAQRVDHIIELAEVCKDREDIVFVVLGKGTCLPSLKQMTEEKQLRNVVFKDFLPQEQYLRFLAACDVGMIILNENMATPNFPSKSLSYLNMKVPILAALDHVTDFGLYLEKNGAGLWAYSDDISALKDKLIAYYTDSNMRMNVAQQGYALYRKSLTPRAAYDCIMQKINNI